MKDSSFSKDLFLWKCTINKCGKKVSIRQGSWFSNSNLTLENIVFITYSCVYRATEDFVIHELEVSRQTIVDFWREVCVVIGESISRKVGGPGRIVEIDESKFGKRKYHRK